MKDQVLAGFVKSFTKNRGLDGWSDSEIFEAFAVSSLLRKYHQTEFSDLEDVLTGGGGDGGIDAVAILVNGHPVQTEADVNFFLDTLRRLDVEFVFVQAKSSAAFDGGKIGTFVHGVEQFFSTEPSITFRDEIEQIRRLKNYIYERSISMQENPDCYLYYVATGTWGANMEPESRLSDGRKRLKATNLFRSVSAIPVDGELLKSIYRELERGVEKEIEFGKTALFPKVDGVSEAYVGLLSGDQFINLISTEDGALNRELFYDNVRDFQGHNPVNREIAQSLKDKDARSRFALLNNGVTIVARSINRTGDVFKISDFQIVNGCQTSHIIYQNREVIDDKAFVPVKLVVTDDSEVITEVIKATNRQTAVLPEALESLTPFHKELEDFYLVQGSNLDKQSRIYYERRSKQYALDRIRATQVVSLTAQTKSFVAMFLNEPHSHHRYYGELLRSYEERLFVQGHAPEAYYASGAALLAVENLFNRGRISRTFRKFKYHILMLLRIQIAGHETPKLNSNQMGKYASKLIDGVSDSARCQQECRKAIGVIQKKLESWTGDKRGIPRLRNFTERLIDSTGTGKIESTSNEPRVSTKERGKIIWYDDWKNFGFIERDAGGNIFVHRSGISKVPFHLQVPGTRVEYIVGSGPKSYKAVEVQVIE